MLSEKEIEKILSDNIHIAPESDEWAVDIIAGMLEDVPKAAHAIHKRLAEGVVHSEEGKWDTEWLVWPVVRLKRPLVPYPRGPDDVMPGVTFIGHGPERYEEFPGQRVRVYVVKEEEDGS